LDIDFFMRCCPSGGTEGYDGWDLGGPLFELGEGRFPDLEIIELIKPVHILQYEQEQDTEGSGKFRSGLGHVYKVQYLSDVDNGHLFGAGMRDFSTPSGLFGGNCPRPTTVVVHRTDGRMEKLDVHIFLKLLAGDIMEEHSMGGGGFGKPFERDVERVRQDVKNGVVSIEKAEKDYGVVIDPFTLKINIGATEELRKGK
jgi:N-methylhydantoinase B